jgi:hypothetical protein
MALSDCWQAGVTQMEKILALWIKNEATLRWTLCSFILAKLYLQVFLNSEKKESPNEAGDRGQINQKIHTILTNCSQSASSSGMTAIEGQIWLNIGKFNKHLGKLDEARNAWQNALMLFERCNADFFHQQASEALEAVSKPSVAF